MRKIILLLLVYLPTAIAAENELLSVQVKHAFEAIISSARLSTRIDRLHEPIQKNGKIASKRIKKWRK